MWRKWNNPREPTIGRPTLMETSVDEGYLETIMEVESIRSRPGSVATALPELPFRAVPPMRDNDPIYRQSISSVYSQPSPTLPPDEPTEQNTKSPGGPDVSPMSTPRSSVNFAASDTSLVSPIESTFHIPPRPPHPEQQSKSHIPRPANISRPAQQTPVEKKTEETKWDDYSGEPTTEEGGRPSQARPGKQQPLEMQYPQLKERTKQILAGLRDRGQAQHKTTWGRAPPPVATDPLDNPVQKEPWKGASGREALVAPVKNTPSARAGPIKHPQRNVSKMDPVQDQARTKSPEGRDPEYAPTQRQSPEPLSQQVSQRTYATQPNAKTSPRPDLSIRVVPSQEEIKPVAPLKVKSPQVRSPVGAENVASLQSPFHTPQSSQPTVDSNIATILRNERKGENDQAHVDSLDLSRTAEGNRPKQANETNQHLGTSQLQPEPVSRLSWTTYATTTNDSPDSLGPTQIDTSPVPPLPSMSSPLIIRKRPVSAAPNSLPFSNFEAAGSRASIISRKPVPAERGRSVSGLSMASKSLPPTPIEMQAGDKVTTLEARLEDLARRRRNNGKLIREMKEGLKRNAIAYSAGKRREVEKQITNLEQELDDIGREEHEVGLRLHRAQKKRDREDCYENPTGLWIKRVTN